MTKRHRYMLISRSRIPVVLIVSLAALLAAACGSGESAETIETVEVRPGEEIGGEAPVEEKVLGEGVTFIGGTTSFGECAGFCYDDLRLEERDVTLTFKTWGDIKHVITATLTDEGAEEVSAASYGLAGASLIETFGCPDCADGGAATLDFRASDGEVSDFAFEYGLPLDELSAAWKLAESLRLSLAKCQDSALVVVGNECVPIADVDDGYN